MSRPKRPRTSRIEDVNQRAFEDALGEFFVFRELRRDIGVDGQVEIFADDDTTGLTFDVQLRATDAKDVKRARRVRLRHGQVDYWRSRQDPNLIVRYLGATGQLYARWLHSYDRHYDGEPSEKTLPLPMRDEDELTPVRRDRLAAEVEAYRNMQRAALRLPLCFRAAVAGAAMSHAELLLALRSANRTPDVLDISAEPGRPQDLRMMAGANRLSVELAGVTGATMHVSTADVPREQIARELLVLCAMAFVKLGQAHLAGRMARAYLAESVLAEDADAVMTFSSAMAQARQVREALELAEELDELGGEAAGNSSSMMLVALVHAGALSEPEARTRIATLNARVKRRIATGDRSGAAAESVSLANAQRHLGAHGRALAALERALRLDPGYADRAHFYDERAATRFFAERYREAAEDYRSALRLGAEPFLRALAADATLLSGQYAEAEEELRTFLQDESDPVRAAEYELKMKLCEELARRGMVRQLRQSAEANRVADRSAKAGMADGTDGAQAAIDLAQQALNTDGLCSLAWLNLAVSLRQAGADDDQVARAWLCAAVTMEWDPTVWADAMLSNADEELVLPLLLTARRMTAGRVFETLATLARERGLQNMLDGLPGLISSLPPERDVAVTVRFIAGGEVDLVRIPSRTSPART